MNMVSFPGLAGMLERSARVIDDIAELAVDAVEGGLVNGHADDVADGARHIVSIPLGERAAGAPASSGIGWFSFRD